MYIVGSLIDSTHIRFVNKSKRFCSKTACIKCPSNEEIVGNWVFRVDDIDGIQVYVPVISYSKFLSLLYWYTGPDSLCFFMIREMIVLNHTDWFNSMADATIMSQLVINDDYSISSFDNLEVSTETLKSNLLKIIELLTANNDLVRDFIMLFQCRPNTKLESISLPNQIEFPLTFKFEKGFRVGFGKTPEFKWAAKGMYTKFNSTFFGYYLTREELNKVLKNSGLRFIEIQSSQDTVTYIPDLSQLSLTRYSLTDKCYLTNGKFKFYTDSVTLDKYFSQLSGVTKTPFGVIPDDEGEFIILDTSGSFNFDRDLHIKFLEREFVTTVKASYLVSKIRNKCVNADIAARGDCLEILIEGDK